MYLSLRDKKLDLNSPKIMGILNVTPDSFSDGGLFFLKDNALKHAEQMIKDGAHIIDIGAESTRPGALDIDDNEQLDRLLYVVSAIAENFDTIISIDTSSTQVIKECVKQGAHMWNDIRALSATDAIKTAKDLDVGICLMHMQGTPRSMQENPTYEDVVGEVKDFLLDRAQKCLDAGIDRDKIILDPGFGFGKSVNDNYKLLSHLNELKDTGYPILSALSRKSMLGAATGVKNAHDRLIGSVTGAVISILNGAQIVRVHDVKETHEALLVAQFVKDNR